MKELIDKLEKTCSLEKRELKELIGSVSPQLSEYLFKKSRKAAKRRFDNRIYIRGLIEFTNCCKNNCYYCGIRSGNRNLERYRLSSDEILDCCENGYLLGFRTFVLQGGEDPFYSARDIAKIVSRIKQRYPDCAVTLSIGERDSSAYRLFREAGADRYLLRHETANDKHYALLHPDVMSLENRKNCLWALKRLGYQVGTGFMVGSPYQTVETLAEDLLFIKELSPEMIGIGPFIPHHDTPFHDKAQGSLELTLFLIGLLRLMLPNALIPATTALGTVHPKGRELGILAGANVLMPNLSPVRVRKSYQLYDNKICTGEEAAECIECLRRRVSGIGYEIVTDRGDFKNIKEEGFLEYV